MKKHLRHAWVILLSIFQGTHQLLMDPCGTICLICIAVVSVLCWYKKVGDVSFAACVTIIPGLIALVKHGSFNGADIDKHSVAQRGSEEPAPKPIPASEPTPYEPTAQLVTPVAPAPQPLPPNPAKNVAPNPK